MDTYKTERARDSVAERLVGTKGLDCATKEVCDLFYFIASLWAVEPANVKSATFSASVTRDESLPSSLEFLEQ